MHLHFRCEFLKEAMTKPSPLSRILRSKMILLTLLVGNLTLGLTTFVQSRVIAGQNRLIHLLYSDSSELAGLKISVNMEKAKKH